MTGRTREGAGEEEMSEHEQDDDGLIRDVARALRASEPAAPDFTGRLMAAVRAERGSAIGSGARAPRARSWLRRSRTLQLSISPLGALATAAALVGLAVLGTHVDRGTGSPSVRAGANAPAEVASRETGARPDTVHLVRFVFLAPHASSVVMVGDFNNWNRSATPLRRVGLAGTWTVSVSLPSGLHEYAFIVDGSKWMPDPATSTTVSDEFKTTTSVIAVGGEG